MLLAVRISSYGCTWEVWRALKKLELLSAAPRATLTLLSCSPNFPRAFITRYTHAKHEPILNSLPLPLFVHIVEFDPGTSASAAVCPLEHKCFATEKPGAFLLMLRRCSSKRSLRVRPVGRAATTGDAVNKTGGQTSEGIFNG